VLPLARTSLFSNGRLPGQLEDEDVLAVGSMPTGAPSRVVSRGAPSIETSPS